MSLSSIRTLRAGEPKPPDWQDAVADLRAERERAVACAARARALDTQKADGLAFHYAMAKAEVDAVIDGLSVTLARRGKPANVQDLRARMRKGAGLREAFCKLVLERAPLEPGQKGMLADVLGAFIKPLEAAVAAMWGWWREEDSVRRDTIRAQLEAARWPEFSAIPPAT